MCNKLALTRHDIHTSGKSTIVVPGLYGGSQSDAAIGPSKPNMIKNMIKWQLDKMTTLQHDILGSHVDMLCINYDSYALQVWYALH